MKIRDVDCSGGFIHNHILTNFLPTREQGEGNGPPLTVTMKDGTVHRDARLIAFGAGPVRFRGFECRHHDIQEIEW